MKITFVEPQPAFNGYFFAKLPMLGPIYLGTILKRRGHDVRVVCGCLEKLYKPRRQWVHPALLDADVVGFTTLTSSVKSAYGMARIVRQRRPDTRILMGGPHASYVHEEAREHADVVVRGEAEPVIIEAVEGASRGVLLDGSFVDDLDTLPIPDLSLLGAGHRRLWMAPLSASRGCPYGCNFCVVSRMFGRRHRARSPESILDELELLQREGHRRVMFYDDNFAGNRRWTAEVLEGMLRRGIRLRWAAQARAEVGRDRALVRLMARTNCALLLLGLESVNPATLDEYGKHQSVEEVVDALAVLSEHRVPVCGMFILGADNDDPETVRATLRFCREARLDYAQFSILFPIPGTPLFDQLQRQGRILTKDWSFFDGSHVVFSPARFVPAALHKWYVWAWKKFYRLRRGKSTRKRFFFQYPVEWAAVRWMVKRWRRVNKHYLSWLKGLLPKRLRKPLPTSSE